jgi:ADP-heptose:LPS heptosyltransferase
VILRQPRIHSAEQQLALLNWTGLPCFAQPPRANLVVSPEARAILKVKLQALGGLESKEARGFACIVPGAAFESKTWSPEGFGAVIDHLFARWGLPSVVVAGPGQESLANQVVAAARSRTEVVSGLRLKELVALLETTVIFVGNDSGPMHIAAALNRPVVAVWGSSDPTVWHPWTNAAYRVVEAPAARLDAREQKDIGRGPELQSPNIKMITASEVIAAVDEVVESALEADYCVNQPR